MEKTYIMVDIEANGPIPGDYSMTQLGAVIINDSLNKRFSIDIEPLNDKVFEGREKFVVKSNITPKEAMERFRDWIKKNVEGKPVFISDNNGFDWMFVCWYFWHFLGENPLGYSSENLQSQYRGYKKNLNVKIEELRSRNLTHEAVEDALDNAKAFKKLWE